MNGKTSSPAGPPRRFASLRALRALRGACLGPSAPLQYWPVNGETSSPAGPPRRFAALRALRALHGACLGASAPLCGVARPSGFAGCLPAGPACRSPALRALQALQGRSPAGPLRRTGLDSAGDVVPGAVQAWVMTLPVLMPLPSQDFEPTEAAVPWRVLREAGIDVVFATPDGAPAACDPLALEGVVFKQIGAKPKDAATYAQMIADPTFRSPIRYDAIEVADYAALHLAGGHAPGMVPYLESEVLQARVADFFVADKPVSAVCHGPVLLARAKDPRTGKSVLHGRRMTALTKLLEGSGFWLTRWTLGRHFRTYPEYVQDEVVRAVGDAAKFETGPIVPSYSNPFTVTDGNLMTARWPGDAERLAQILVQRLQAPPAG